MFGFLKKFERAAVLTDKTWLKKVSGLEGAFDTPIKRYHLCDFL
jgi:hypothetical protein